MIIEYDYQRRSKEVDSGWLKVNEAEMMKALGNSYVDTEAILHVMHDGLVVNTPFAQYKATKRYVLTRQ